MATQNGQSKANLILVLIYLLIVFSNWGFILWLESSVNLVETSFFLFIPLFGYFYFTFAFISSLLIYRKSRLGFSIACCVLTFGMIMDVVAYTIVNITGVLYEALVITFVILNVCTILMLASLQSKYSND